MGSSRYSHGSSGAAPECWRPVKRSVPSLRTRRLLKSTDHGASSSTLPASGNTHARATQYCRTPRAASSPGSRAMNAALRTSSSSRRRIQSPEHCACSQARWRS